MLSQNTGKLLQILRINTLANGRKMGYVSHFKPVTMSELPVPRGSWENAYAIKQRKYNTTLAAGVTIFAVTLGFFVNSGIINFGRGPMHLIGKSLD